MEKSPDNVEYSYVKPNRTSQDIVIQSDLYKRTHALIPCISLILISVNLQSTQGNLTLAQYDKSILLTLRSLDHPRDSSTMCYRLLNSSTSMIKSRFNVDNQLYTIYIANQKRQGLYNIGIMVCRQRQMIVFLNDYYIVDDSQL